MRKESAPLAHQPPDTDQMQSIPDLQCMISRLICMQCTACSTVSEGMENAAPFAIDAEQFVMVMEAAVVRHRGIPRIYLLPGRGHKEK